MNVRIVLNRAMWTDLTLFAAYVLGIVTGMMIMLFIIKMSEEKKSGQQKKKK